MTTTTLEATPVSHARSDPLPSPQATPGLPPYIRWLRDIDRACIAAVGGKGANLGELARAGLPVPDAFVVTTATCEAFLDANALRPRIVAELSALDVDRPEQLREAATRLQDAIRGATLPREVRRAIVEAYRTLSGATNARRAFVAVRSSATAEDAASSSFAGMFESFLDVHGDDALATAVRNCWLRRPGTVRASGVTPNTSSAGASTPSRSTRTSWIARGTTSRAPSVAFSSTQRERRPRGGNTKPLTRGRRLADRDPDARVLHCGSNIEARGHAHMRPTGEDTMVTLKDIMTREVLTVSPDLPIRDLMELLVTRHVSGVPVVSGGKVIGVVSTTDLMTFTAGLLAGSSDDAPTPEDPEESPTPDDDATAQVDEPMATWFTEMWSEERGDVSSRLEEQAESTSALDSQTVADVMTRPPLSTMSPEASIDHAADYMRRAGVHRLLVMTGDRLEGIVTTTDLANAVADHKNVIRTFVFDRHGGHLS